MYNAKPQITDYRYRDMTKSEKDLNYQRDLMLWEQTEALKAITGNNNYSYYTSYSAPITQQDTIDEILGKIKKFTKQYKTDKHRELSKNIKQLIQKFNTYNKLSIIFGLCSIAMFGLPFVFIGLKGIIPNFFSNVRIDNIPTLITLFIAGLGLSVLSLKTMNYYTDKKNNTFDDIKELYAELNEYTEALNKTILKNLYLEHNKE